jgi:murein endopeptidase
VCGWCASVGLWPRLPVLLAVFLLLSWGGLARGGGDATTPDVDAPVDVDSMAAAAGELPREAAQAGSVDPKDEADFEEDAAAGEEEEGEGDAEPQAGIVLDETGLLEPGAAVEPPAEGIPSEEVLRKTIATAPESLGPLSIGSPDAGALLNGVQLRDGPFWKVRDPNDAWATEETRDFLETAITAVATQYPGSPPLIIGDLSPHTGGSAGRHRSHQSGRDADVGWYFNAGPVDRLDAGTARNLDLPRCWTLVRAFVTETDVERIFIDRSIQRLLFKYALESGEDAQWLDSIFATPGGRSGTIVQHERRHKNHLHVRFYNRRAQEWGRVAYPLLVEAQLLPPPVILHKARSGDTLSTIARRYGARVSAIRAANGLRSSFIRAGRRYRIPVRLAAARFIPPVVVPPRRLPPPSGRVAAHTPADVGTPASAGAPLSGPLAQAP